MSLNARGARGRGRAGAAGAEGRLKRELSSFAVLLLTLSSLSPVVSVFGVGGDVLHQAGAGAAMLFGLAILAALVWSVVYAELGSAYPYAGGDYVGVGSVLGGWAGVVTLALWAVTAGPSIAFVAETMVPYVAQLAPRLPAPLVTFGGLAAADRGGVAVGGTGGLDYRSVPGRGRPSRGFAEGREIDVGMYQCFDIAGRKIAERGHGMSLRSFSNECLS